MAENFAPSMGQAIYNGASGNLSTAIAEVELKAATAGTVIHMLDLPIGVQILGFDIVTDGLGASVKLELKAGDKVIANNQDVANKMAKYTPVKPAYIKEHHTKLDVVTSGGAATGKLFIYLKYRFIGY